MQQTPISPSSAIPAFQTSLNNETIERRPKWKKIISIIGIGLVLIVLCFGYLIFQGAKDAPEVRDTVTEFLQYASNNDFENAYSLTSDEFKKTLSTEDLGKTLSLLKAQYTGFSKQTQAGFSVEANVGQPTVYKYSGTITYTDGDTGTVQANLIKENGTWKITYIFVSIDIKRLEKFQQSNDNSVLGVNTE